MQASPISGGGVSGDGFAALHERSRCSDPQMNIEAFEVEIGNCRHE